MKMTLLGLMATVLASSGLSCGDESTGANEDVVPKIEQVQTLEEVAGETVTGQPHFDDVLSPVQLRWNNVASNKLSHQDELSLTVENVSQLDLVVSATLVFRGLIKHSATVDLGDFDLPAQESIDLTLPANEIPIQNKVGASGVRAEIEIATAASQGGRTMKVVSNSVYYKHSADYGKVAVFGQRVLLDKLEGKLSRKMNGAIKKGELMGRVADRRGKFKSITALDDKFARKIKRRGKDEVVGWEMGMDVEVHWETDPKPKNAHRRETVAEEDLEEPDHVE